MESVDAGVPPRRRGRPRSDGAERAILAAGLRLLAERGVQRMSMEAVAAAARVSKATIYRRWASKDALVLDLIALAAGQEGDDRAAEDEEDVRAELLLWLRRSLEDAGPRAAALQHLMRRAADDPNLAAALRRRELRRRRDGFAAIIDRGIRAGRIRPDLDPAILLDMLSGPLLYRRLLEPGSGASLDPHGEALAMVEIVWPGICAGGRG